MNWSRASGWRRWSLVRSAALRSGLATMASICARDNGAIVVTVDVAVELLVVVTGTMGGSCDAQPNRVATRSATGARRAKEGVMECLVELVWRRCCQSAPIGRVGHRPTAVSATGSPHERPRLENGLPDTTCAGHPWP